MIHSNATSKKRDSAPRTSYFEEVVTVFGAQSVQWKCMGEFRMMDSQTGKAQDFRPMYKNINGRYLYYNAERRRWLISSHWNKREGLLMSGSDAQTPQDASDWMALNGSQWETDLDIRVKATGDGLQQPNEDGIIVGQFVCAMITGSRSCGKSFSLERFREGERGRVVGMVDRRIAKVEFEGRSSEIVPVATKCLHALPEHLVDEWKR
jgi:hypothetical protein